MADRVWLAVVGARHAYGVFEGCKDLLDQAGSCFDVPLPEPFTIAGLALRGETIPRDVHPDAHVGYVLALVYRSNDERSVRSVRDVASPFGDEPVATEVEAASVVGWDVGLLQPQPFGSLSAGFPLFGAVLGGAHNLPPPVECLSLVVFGHEVDPLVLRLRFVRVPNLQLAWTASCAAPLREGAEEVLAVSNLAVQQLGDALVPAVASVRGLDYFEAPVAQLDATGGPWPAAAQLSCCYVAVSAIRCRPRGRCICPAPVWSPVEQHVRLRRQDDMEPYLYSWEAVVQLVPFVFLPHVREVVASPSGPFVHDDPV